MSTWFYNQCSQDSNSTFLARSRSCNIYITSFYCVNNLTRRRAKEGEIPLVICYIVICYIVICYIVILSCVGGGQEKADQYEEKVGAHNPVCIIIISVLSGILCSLALYKIVRLCRRFFRSSSDLTIKEEFIKKVRRQCIENLFLEHF